AIAPPGRAYPQMVFDNLRGRALVFGGLQGSLLNDAWARNGTMWSPLPGATLPAGRTPIAIVYDDARDRVVMLASTGSLPPTVPETWEWNASPWTQRLPVTSPSHRDSGIMAFDRARGRTVLFGGQSQVFNGGIWSPVALDDTWEWDGTTWSQATPAAHPQAL